MTSKRETAREIRALLDSAERGERVGAKSFRRLGVPQPVIDEMVAAASTETDNAGFAAVWAPKMIAELGARPVVGSAGLDEARRRFGEPTTAQTAGTR